ncbi:ATP-binding protein [Desulfovibrio sp. JC010]|uniref:PAS domain-containing sensor histidine kinase n=1 Tax=Desulfovibrio sp. JC010 TaxID=2593641 RepID=UPI0013D5AE30|nr:ATP-binding protein [Desulfovibrio sp. JC010]NDV28073.1 PAS domain S-box protein [Desulfovibrio sp. JC010]
MFKSNKAIPAALALIAIFVISIIWTNYRSQVDLRKASLVQFSEYSQREADSLSHFFSERRNDLIDLSASRELLSYFDNKALGMAPEYGLHASLIQISELFSRIIKIKQINDVPIYSRLVFVDQSKKILADNEHGRTRNTLCKAPIPPDLIHQEVRIVFKKSKDKTCFILMLPYMFRGEKVGTILAWLNAKEILPFQEGSSPDSGLKSFNYLIYDKDVYCPFNEIPLQLAEKISSNRNIPAGRVSELLIDLEQQGKPLQTFIVRSVVEGTPFSLLSITPEAEVVGTISPRNLLIYTILLALLLLGGGIFIIKINARNLVLNIRVEEAAKQAEKIEQKNKQLINEVEARSHAEKALMQINDELETRVQKRTAALKKQADALTREVQERREAETAMRLIFDNTHDSIFIHDVEGDIITVNDTMLEVYKVNKEEAVQYNIKDDYSAPDLDLEILDEKWKQALNGEKVLFEWTARRPEDGHLFEVEVALNRIELGGEIVILANVHDISEQKKVLIQQAEHQEFLGTIFEGLGAAVFVFDPTIGMMVDCNSVGEKLLNMSRNAILNAACQTEFSFTSDTKKDLLCPNWHEQGSYEEGILTLKDSAPLPVSRHLFEIHISGTTHLVQVVFDITDRKHLERKLNIAQKLESIGLLASGIAHEINTPIQYVGDSIRFVKEAYGDTTELLEMYERYIKAKSSDTQSEILEEIEEHKDDIDLEFIETESIKACDRALEGVERVAKIVLAMKNFSHSGEEKPKAVDINKAIRNTIEVSRNEWKYAAELETALEPDLPPVQCLPGAINQVLLNVIVNAAHAIADNKDGEQKGIISVTTKFEPPFATIIIKDTGCGISKENMHKIFDPFFTTKEVGKGTGQGLAIVHDIIVEKHGGTIDIESEEGVGTAFIIRLPIEGIGESEA